MKNYLFLIIFISNFALAVNNLPYPPQDSNPAYMLPKPAPYPVQYDFTGFHSSDQTGQAYSGTYRLTGCNIAQGTYRADLTTTPDSDAFSGAAKLYIQVNDGGLLTMIYKYTEFMGKQELYTITPYRNHQDLSTVCAGNHFTFAFEHINFYHFKLEGYISGNFIANGSSGYLNVKGKIKRINTQSNHEIKKKLSDTKLKYIYSYR